MVSNTDQLRCDGQSPKRSPSILSLPACAVFLRSCAWVSLSSPWIRAASVTHLTTRIQRKWSSGLLQLGHKEQPWSFLLGLLEYLLLKCSLLEHNSQAVRRSGHMEGPHTGAPGKEPADVPAGNQHELLATWMSPFQSSQAFRLSSLNCYLTAPTGDLMQGPPSFLLSFFFLNVIKNLGVNGFHWPKSVF